jgi:hypothetical protein
MIFLLYLDFVLLYMDINLHFHNILANELCYTQKIYVKTKTLILLGCW